MKTWLSVFCLFMMQYFACGQVIEELQITFGDGSRDTFSFVTGNRGNVPSFNLQNVKLSAVTDVNGSTRVCDSIPDDLSGFIALLDRGTCSFDDKYENVGKKGAIGFLVCNTSNSSVPQVGNFSSSYKLPTGTMSLSECNQIRFRLDENASVNWISEYLLSCDDTDETISSLCSEAYELGEILDCPSFDANSQEFSTYNSCAEDIPAESCFASEYGAKWVQFSTGEDMTSVEIFLFTASAGNAFLEIYSGIDCDASLSLIECLSGDSTHLVENLLPETTYYGLIGEQVKSESAEVFIQVKNAECRYQVAGKVYHDVNDNGIKDEDEEYLSDIRFNHINSDRFFVTNDSGGYSTVFSPLMDTILIADVELCWVFRDSEDMYLSAADGLEQQRDIPLLSTGNSEEGVGIKINASRARCNEIGTVIIKVENIGCVNLSDTVDVQIEPLLKFVDTTGLLNATENSFSFIISDLVASSVFTFSFEVTIPDESFDGNSFQISASTDEVVTIYSDLIRCAIDPNDKQVLPTRDFPNNYTQKDELLTYRIRFQNTGSDTAFTVAIKDTLSPFLDWNSVSITESSHEAVFLVEDGVLTMVYEDINLVDSITNEPESHGFFTFKVGIKEDVADFTVVSNSASIYFDQNQPIITNVVSSTIVTSLDADSDGYFFWEECDDSNFGVNPGRAEIINNDVDENCDGIVEVYDSAVCDVVLEDFSTYNEGFFVGQDGVDWIYRTSGSKNGTIFNWGDFQVLDIASDYNQSNVDYDAQIVQELELVDPDIIELSFTYYNECGIVALEFYEDSTFVKFAELVITSYDFDNYQNAFYIQQDTFENCYPSPNSFQNYRLALLFADNELQLYCPTGDTIRVPFYQEADDFYGIGWGSNQCAYISDICIASQELIDEDVDGFSSLVDCNDQDASINPGAEEIPNNDVDENCDGLLLIIDMDFDGFNSDIDCNDQDASINPDAIDIPNNGIDENCDGVDMTSSSDEEFLGNIGLYPNPARDLFMVDLGASKGRVRILNIHGQAVQSSLSLSKLHELSLEDQAAGIYYVEVDLENGQKKMLKLVKI